MRGCFLFISLFIATNLNASHFNAADITYTQDSINSRCFSVTLRAYSPLPGNIGADFLQFDWGDGFVRNVPLASTSLVIPGLYCQLFIDTHTYATSIQNEFVISIDGISRSNGIKNIQNGNSVEVPFCVSATINISIQSSLNSNHSPVFSSTPVFIGYKNQLYYQKLDLFDADGDSLVVEAAIPLSDWNVYVPDYLMPNQYLPGPNNFYLVDNSLREIIWNSPPTVGVFSVAYTVTEFRNGYLLGSISRDQNIFVLEDTLNSIYFIQKDENIYYATNENAIVTRFEHMYGEVSYFVASSTGQLLLQNTITQPNFTIDLSTLPPGLYFLQLTNGSRRAVKRFVKQ